MKGGVDEQVHVIQDEGAIDVDVDAASVALELPGIEAAGGRQADVAAAVMREVLRFDRDAVVSEVGRASDDTIRRSGPMRRAIISRAICSPCRTPASYCSVTMSMRAGSIDTST